MYEDGGGQYPWRELDGEGEGPVVQGCVTDLLEDLVGGLSVLHASEGGKVGDVQGHNQVSTVTLAQYLCIHVCVCVCV